MKPCGNPDCCSSTGICDSVTHGSGELDDFGYWEFPCYTCARHYESIIPEYTHWPFKIKNDTCKVNSSK